MPDQKDLTANIEAEGFQVFEENYNSQNLILRYQLK